MGRKSKKKYYVVVQGRKPGLYYQWFGEEGAADQIRNMPDALFKGFYTLQAARDWLSGMQGVENLLSEIDMILKHPAGDSASAPKSYEAALQSGKVVIFTDGGCAPNPGPGGYGVVLLFQDKQGKLHRRELSGGFRETTNNRMEITAGIQGLKALKRSLPTILYSDSKYVVDAVNLGWARQWRRRGWRRKKKGKAENSDLWGNFEASELAKTLSAPQNPHRRKQGKRSWG